MFQFGKSFKPMPRSSGGGVGNAGGSFGSQKKTIFPGSTSVPKAGTTNNSPWSSKPTGWSNTGQAGGNKTSFGVGPGATGSIGGSSVQDATRRKNTGFGQALFGKKKDKGVESSDSEGVVKVRFMPGGKDQKEGINVKYNSRSSKKRYEVTIGDEVRESTNSRVIKREVAKELNKQIAKDSRSNSPAKRHWGLQPISPSSRRSSLGRLKKDSLLEKTIGRDIAGSLGRKGSSRRSVEIKGVYNSK